MFPIALVTITLLSSISTHTNYSAGHNKLHSVNRVSHYFIFRLPLNRVACRSNRHTTPATNVHEINGLATEAASCARSRRRVVAAQRVHQRAARRAVGRGAGGAAALLLRPGGRRALLHPLVPRRDRVLPLRSARDATHDGLPAARRLCGRK